ncbi:Methionyl-tRNA formyltransferase [Thermodesulfobacterium geofontis OPF15]|jgi:methionyl-tRNA formyltransferase|uniref:Methionyl-tRNA formyltransferase n=1 Tax=Thermodesulfobacterium geofontis (strain OPF15) TaxID=795359 RepID=F8C5W0_THEGP|nr:methionyl-tRNA formyltransferase [Thermodesulfobacterium geofontis]AEH23101.1 Methionyl-tRNA formyltransferase [Thermodesulfobacterium geofontis OPF15]
MKKYRIIFFGSPEFAIPSLEALYEKEEVIAVVTQPDKPKGRGLKPSPSPVKAWASSKGLKVLEPIRLKDPQFIQILKDLSPDLIVVCAYGKIIPKEILEIPKFGCWNIHASLLPKYRGASPINWAILEGEKETGITIMLMDEGLDTGPILLQKKIPISENDDANSLSQKLAQLGKETILSAIELHKKGELKIIPQPEEGISYAPILKKEDGFFTFEEPAEKIEKKIKAFLPWPSAFTYYKNKLLKVFSAKAVPLKHEEKPGTILDINKDGILVATSKDAILLKEVQLEGKKKISAYEFACGQRLKKGVLWE